jgi:16S rRNA (cytidine1402-2'-O)-methyltransferase
VFFESSHRIMAALEDFLDAFGPVRQATLCRELTKQFETLLRGTFADLHQRLLDEPVQQKGELVIVVAGYEASQDERVAAGLEMAQALLEYLSASQAAKIAAKLTGAPRRTLYDLIGKQTD